MKFKNIIRMAVMLSFLFFNNSKIFANINDYVKIKNDYKKEYQSRTSHLSGDEDFLFFEADEEFTY